MVYYLAEDAEPKRQSSELLVVQINASFILQISSG
jgi:hypothetical protein